MADPNRVRAGPKQAASRPTASTTAPTVAGRKAAACRPSSPSPPGRDKHRDHVGRHRRPVRLCIPRGQRQRLRPYERHARRQRSGAIRLLRSGSAYGRGHDRGLHEPEPVSDQRLSVPLHGRGELYRQGGRGGDPHGHRAGQGPAVGDHGGAWHGGDDHRRNGVTPLQLGFEYRDPEAGRGVDGVTATTTRTASYTPTTAGTYQFRSRMRDLTTSAASGYGPAVSLTAH